MTDVVRAYNLQLETSLIMNPQYVGQVYDIAQGVENKKLLATYIAIDTSGRLIVILYKSNQILEDFHTKIVQIIQDFETAHFLLRDPRKIVTAILTE